MSKFIYVIYKRFSQCGILCTAYKYYNTLYILYTSVFIVLFFNCCIIIILTDNREYLMEQSSLIKFIEKYRDSKLTLTKLRKIFDKEVDKQDFDKNKESVWSWFTSIKK